MQTTDGAGWRLLSLPVAGFNVDDLAALNLVQGVPGAGANGTPASDPGATNVEQYPTAPVNVYTDYDATAGFSGPANTDLVLNPGRGFFWYLYDNNVIPSGTQNGGGTSRSYELSTRPLEATGLALTATFTELFDDAFPAGGPSDSRYYLVGNPFSQPLCISAAAGANTTGGITVNVGGTDVPIQAGQFSLYDPATGYTGRSADGACETADADDFLGVWQGAVIEVAAAGDVTVEYDATQRDAAATPVFVGRPSAAEGLAFVLDGVLASGGATADGAARVRFAADALAGWDRHDASKLPALTAGALVAPVLERDGAPYRASVTTLPVADATVPLAFTATEAGAFTLSWTGALPDGFSGSLRDLSTGAVVDLAAGSHAFTSGATGWADRFELVVAQGLVGTQGAPVGGLVVGAVAPNPTRGAATVRVDAPAATVVTVEIVDALGRRLATVDAVAGTDVSLPVGRLAPGRYLVRVTAGAETAARALTVVR